MQIELNKEYRTRENLKAVVTYKQPGDVVDEFPFIGYVLADDVKIGFCWSPNGEAGESSEFDLVETQ